MTLDDATPYLTGNFAPVEEEVTAFDLPVVGQIPTELEGRLLRNGPNPIEIMDPPLYHWFIGDGMVHGLRLSGGKAQWYRNRYVGSQRVEEKLGRESPNPVTDRGGPNTNVIGHAGRTYALVESGPVPVELTYELETIGTDGFCGSLPHGYSAHPKYDPLTGEMHSINYAPAKILDKVEYVVIGIEGHLTKRLEITCPTMPMIHDMGLTQKYVVVLDLPLAADLDLAAAGDFLPVRWYDGYDARVGLLPRSAESEEEIIWCPVDPGYVFHVLNSYDTPSGQVIMDVVRYDRVYANDRNGPFRDSMPKLERWTIDPARRQVTRDVIDERAQEFPRVAGSVLNQQHRFGYTTSVGSNPETWEMGETIKHDLDAGTSVVHDHGPGRGASEPVFISRENATAEDDGWLMTVVYDQSTDRSDVVILDAADVSGDEVARIQLPTRIPEGFHGNWVRDSVTPPPA